MGFCCGPGSAVISGNRLALRRVGLEKYWAIGLADLVASHLWKHRHVRCGCRRLSRNTPINRVYGAGSVADALSFGMAFLVAMVPAPQAWSILIVPMAMAWAGGVSIVGVPSFVLLAGWSIFYLALFGPKWSVGERHSIIRADVSTFCWIFAWLALSIATLIFALWVRV